MKKSPLIHLYCIPRLHELISQPNPVSLMYRQLQKGIPRTIQGQAQPPLEGGNTHLHTGLQTGEKNGPSRSPSRLPSGNQGAGPRRCSSNDNSCEKEVLSC